MITTEKLTGPGLKSRIEAKSAKIGVIGLGYVGLPLAVEYARMGFDTVGFDVSSERVLRLNAGKNYIQDVPEDQFQAVHASGRFKAQDDYAGAEDVDVFYICVPTPVTEHKDPDTTYIANAAESIAANIRAGQLIILKSTTYPDTTEGIVQPIIEAAAKKKGLVLGKDWFLAFSPERIDPGNQKYTTANTPVVVGGVTPACTDMAALAIQQVVAHVHRVSSPKVAEMEKLLENIFRSVNIALVNELARLCDRMGGISMWEVVEAAATKPFGFMPFFPGPGLGGHCIPIDPYYLSWLARRYDFETSFITLSARTNEEMPFYVVDAVIRAAAGQGVKLSNARVLVLGVAFKRDVDDTRHSPAEKVMGLLQDGGFEHVSFADPHVESFSFDTRKGRVTMEATELDSSAVERADVVVLLTDHRAFPYSMIADKAKMIVDTRNAFGKIPHDRDKIMLLGGGDF
jgi:UDP-N-acetyl-D-glucosamine dehydrogenase